MTGMMDMNGGNEYFCLIINKINRLGKQVGRNDKYLILAKTVSRYSHSGTDSLRWVCYLTQIQTLQLLISSVNIAA